VHKDGQTEDTEALYRELAELDGKYRSAIEIIRRLMLGEGGNKKGREKMVSEEFPAVWRDLQSGAENPDGKVVAKKMSFGQRVCNLLSSKKSQPQNREAEYVFSEVATADLRVSTLNGVSNKLDLSPVPKSVSFVEQKASIL